MVVSFLLVLKWNSSIAFPWINGRCRGLLHACMYRLSHSLDIRSVLRDPRPMLSRKTPNVIRVAGPFVSPLLCCIPHDIHVSLVGHQRMFMSLNILYQPLVVFTAAEKEKK